MINNFEVGIGYFNPSNQELILKIHLQDYTCNVYFP